MGLILGWLWHDGSVKRGRRLLWILGACGIVSVLAVAFWAGEREPEYEGKKLSEWISPHIDYYLPRTGSGKKPPDFATLQKANQDAVKAVRAIGTNGLPFLTKWACHETPPWKSNVLVLSARYCPWLDRWTYSEKGRLSPYAFFGFSILGPEASPAIPQLVQFAKGPNTNVAKIAVHLLGSIGDQAVPFIMDALTNRQAYPALPASAVAGPGMFRRVTNRRPVVLALAGCLGHPQPDVRSAAATALPQLLPEARTAVPALTERLKDREDMVRAAALNALAQIAPEALTDEMPK
jgi:hypothetical protein